MCVCVCVTSCVPLTGEMEEQPALLPSDLVLSPSGSSIASTGSGDKIKTKVKKTKVGLIYTVYWHMCSYRSYGVSHICP